MGEALGIDRRLDKSNIPIPGKYLDSKCMLDQMDMLYNCFGIQSPFCAARLGLGYLLLLPRAGMMLTEGVFHFSKRKGEDLATDHDPLPLPTTCIFSIMVKKRKHLGAQQSCYVCESKDLWVPERSSFKEQRDALAYMSKGRERQFPSLGIVVKRERLYWVKGAVPLYRWGGQHKGL